jgi:hypothetical protein
MQGFIRCQEKLLQRNIGIARTWFSWKYQANK